MIDLKAAIVDGQGGGIGKSLIEEFERHQRRMEIIALGTNSLATTGMIKSGADCGRLAKPDRYTQYCDVIMGPCHRHPNSILGRLPLDELCYREKQGFKDFNPHQ